MLNLVEHEKSFITSGPEQSVLDTKFSVSSFFINVDKNLMRRPN